MGSQQMIVEALGKHTATVIFSHGLGDTAAGWYSFAKSLSRRFNYIKFILPTAPVQPVTINNGMPMPSWFDILTLQPPAPGSTSRPSEDESGMLKSVSRMNDYISREIDAGIPASRIIVGGFSQGAVISLLTGITSERKLAGVVSLSGFLGLSSKIEAMQTDHAKWLKIFWGHGTADNVVAYNWGKASVDKLKSMKFNNLEFHSYDGMGHAFCEEENEDLIEWLSKTLPESPFTEGMGGKAAM